MRCVYISSESEHRIQKFSPTGQFISKWGTPGGGDGELDGPASMVFDRDENLYVVDHLNSRVQKFTKEGKFCSNGAPKVRMMGSLICPGASVWTPTATSMSPTGAMTGCRSLPLKANSWLLSVPQATTTVSSTARAALLDRDGNMYVADWGNNRVQVLGPDGRFRIKLLGDAGLSKWAQEFLPANPDYMEARATAKNRETERFLWGPTAVKLDTAGQLYCR